GWDWRDLADFSASINPLGPSPAVFPAIQSALERIVHYPEREPRELQQALAQHWNIDPDCILLGNGATELIHFLSRCAGYWNVALAPPVFTEFHRAFPGAYVGEPSTEHDLIAVTQPVNPTGQIVSLARYLDSPGDLLIDESFLDFTGHPSA